MQKCEPLKAQKFTEQKWTFFKMSGSTDGGIFWPRGLDSDLFASKCFL